MSATRAAVLQPLIDQPRRVDVTAVERELADLWRSAAERSEAEGVALTRTRTLTLLAYAAAPQGAAALAEVASQTSQRHPARAILLVADPDEPALAAEVTASCRTLRRSRKQICSEQIIVRAAPAERDRFPSVVRNLVLPDMPVVLYWPAPDRSDPFVNDLREVADRLIIDSAAFPDGGGALEAAALLSGSGESAPLGDLTWGRLALWRGLTAQFFAPPHAGAAERIGRVRIAHAAATRIQALLYAGWLMARLRWTVKEPVRPGAAPWRAALIDQRGHPIALSLHPESRAPHPAGALLSTMIVAGEATFSIQRNDKAGAVIATAESPSSPATRQALPLEAQDEASLLAVEMDLLGRDRIYEQAVRAAAALLGAA
ncbi:MAG: glucose-6-phosphate dehydrogenase assembly protein OpcA [bacterium]